MAVPMGFGRAAQGTLTTSTKAFGTRSLLAHTSCQLITTASPSWLRTTTRRGKMAPTFGAMASLPPAMAARGGAWGQQQCSGTVMPAPSGRCTLTPVEWAGGRPRSGPSSSPSGWPSATLTR
eukprot:1639489-Rhodomonas_salina.1